MFHMVWTALNMKGTCPSRDNRYSKGDSYKPDDLPMVDKSDKLVAMEGIKDFLKKKQCVVGVPL